MAKPTANTKWSLTGVKTEPTSGQKDAGWVVGQKPPAQWHNWWMDAVDQWVKWLEDFEATAHTWTELQTFQEGVTITGAGVNPDASLEVTASGSNDGVRASSGSSTGMAGLRGIGVDGGAFGKNGVVGQGGSGTTTGGIGVGGVGGIGAGAGGLGAPGGSFIGGNVDGATNTTGAAGIGVDAKGGAISSDADFRKGGTGGRFEGGVGQDGVGPAIQIVAGDLQQLSGSIVQSSAVGNVLGTTQVDGDLTVVDEAFVGAGKMLSEAAINVQGGIGYQNSWVDSTNAGTYDQGSYWKDAEGMVHLQGRIAGGGSTTVAFTLPAGYRPTARKNFPTNNFPSGGGTIFNFCELEIYPNGEVRPRLPGGGVDTVYLDGISFRAA